MRDRRYEHSLYGDPGGSDGEKFCHRVTLGTRRDECLCGFVNALLDVLGDCRLCHSLDKGMGSSSVLDVFLAIQRTQLG